jgi:hypothetical protein
MRSPAPSTPAPKNIVRLRGSLASPPTINHLYVGRRGAPQHGLSVRPLASRFRRPYVSAMDHARIIEQALRDAQDILWTNLPPTHNLPDDATVQELREIVCSTAVTSALKCAADAFFFLRASRGTPHFD